MATRASAVLAALVTLALFAACTAPLASGRVIVSDTLQVHGTTATVRGVAIEQDDGVIRWFWSAPRAVRFVLGTWGGDSRNPPQEAVYDATGTEGSGCVLGPGAMNLVLWVAGSGSGDVEVTYEFDTDRAEAGCPSLSSAIAQVKLARMVGPLAVIVGAAALVAGLLVIRRRRRLQAKRSPDEPTPGQETPPADREGGPPGP